MRVEQLYNPNDNELILWKAIKKITGGLPSQATHAGEFLSTDGIIASWVALTGGGDMLGVNNLSDVVSASTSLTNIGGLAIINNLSDMANPPIENQILFGDASSQATSSDKLIWEEGKEIFTVNGGQKVKQTEVVDADYTVLTSDYEVLASGLTDSRTITLPTASTAKNQIFIIKVSSTVALSYYISVVVSGGTDTINGLVNYKFISGQDSLVLISDGTSNYNIVADSLKPINHLLAQNTNINGQATGTTVLAFTDSSANLTNHIPLYFTVQGVAGTLGICVVKFKTSVNDCTTTVALVNATGNNMIYIPVIAGAAFPNSGNISVEVTVASVAASTFTVNCYGTSR